jgi:hypothetical protein
LISRASCNNDRRKWRVLGHSITEVLGGAK